tara:strand:+ start:1091 stop:1687 length:597 start_codon:yes stop_codon:yes gene_type:complete
MKCRLLVLFILAIGIGPVHSEPYAKELVSVCTSCHGAEGVSLLPTFPNLAGQGKQYLHKQLMDVRDGKRVIPSMMGLLDNMSDKDLLIISEFYGEKKRQFGFARSDLVEMGKSIYRSGIPRKQVAACASCHSPSGTGNGPARFPLLAGQWEEYIVAQLRAFQRGERKNDGDSQMMRGIARDLTELEMEAVASYLRGLR